MIKYEVLVMGELKTNCYLIWEETSKETIIVDAADDGVIISEEIEKLGLKPKYILTTHGHFDHNLGVLDLKLIYNIPYCASQKDWFLLERQKETAKHFLKMEVKVPNLKKIDIDLDKEKEIKLGEEVLKIIKTPGHTPGSICLYYQPVSTSTEKEGLLFSGDTLFRDCRGRTDFEYGSTAKIFESLKKLIKLPKETIVLSGHGEVTSIAREKPKYILKN